MKSINMKTNKYFNTICMVLSVCFIFSCGNNRKDAKTDSIEEEMDSLDIELAEREARMMEEVNWPFVDPKALPDDSLDIRIDDLSIPMLERTFTERGYTIFVLSEDDFNMARKLVKDYFQGIRVDEESYSGNPFPYNHYFKQYIGYKDPDTGKDIIEVNLFTAEQTPHGWAGELKNNWYVYRDGGKNFGHFFIDMKQKRIISFGLNGPI